MVAMTIDAGIVLVLTYLLVSALVVFAFPICRIRARIVHRSVARTPPRTAGRRVAYQSARNVIVDAAEGTA